MVGTAVSTHYDVRSATVSCELIPTSTCQTLAIVRPFVQKVERYGKIGRPRFRHMLSAIILLHATAWKKSGSKIHALASMMQEHRRAAALHPEYMEQRVNC